MLNKFLLFINSTVTNKINMHAIKKYYKTICQYEINGGEYM